MQSSKKYIAALSVVLFVSILGNLSVLLRESSTSLLQNTKDSLTISKDSGDVSNKISVSIEGGVNKPGVYSFVEGTRVSELISQSEGYTANVDLEYIKLNINLSERLKDQQKVYIPVLNDNWFKQRVNINKADSTDISNLLGISVSNAKKIVINRPYQSIIEFKEKSGLTTKLVNQILDKIVL